jgi:hypothetical protein
MGKLAGLPGDEIQEISLRHEGDEFAFRPEMREIGNVNGFIPEMRRDFSHFLMRLAQKIFQQSQLMHELQRRGMNRIAPEIAEEIPMLFQNQNIHAGPGQQKTQHDPRRPATDDATSGVDTFN